MCTRERISITKNVVVVVVVVVRKVYNTAGKETFGLRTSLSITVTIMSVCVAVFVSRDAKAEGSEK